LRERIAVTATSARLDPGPATLVAGAQRLAPLVDVIGFSGAPDPLADDQKELHGAYAQTPMAPDAMGDVLTEADRLGVQVNALQRTAHLALSLRDRGRAPTSLMLDGVRLPEDALQHRFDPAGVRRVMVRAQFGGRGGEIELLNLVPTGSGFEKRLIKAFPTGGAGSVGAESWPDTPRRQIDAILDAVDAAMPELVLTPLPSAGTPPEEATPAHAESLMSVHPADAITVGNQSETASGGAVPSAVPVATEAGDVLSQPVLERAGSAPTAVAADDVIEPPAAAEPSHPPGARTHRPDEEAGVDDLEAADDPAGAAPEVRPPPDPRLSHVGASLRGQVVVAGAATPWLEINPHRLAAHTLVLVDNAVDAVPGDFISAAGVVYCVITDAAVLPLRRMASPGDLKFLAAHSADVGGFADATFAPADYGGAVGPGGGIGLAVRLVRALADTHAHSVTKAHTDRPLAVLGLPAGTDLGSATKVLGEAGQAASAQAFHSLFAQDDWPADLRLAVALSPGRSVQDVWPLFEGLGDRVMFVSTDGARVTLQEGEGKRSPAYTAGDPDIARTIGAFAADVLIAERGAEGSPAMQAVDPRAARLVVPDAVDRDPRCGDAGGWVTDLTAASPRERDLWRLMLSDAVVFAQTGERAQGRHDPSANGVPLGEDTALGGRQESASALPPAAPRLNDLVASAAAAAGRVREKAQQRAQSFVQKPLEESAMANVQARERKGLLDALWPWPGTILLVLIAAWLFYMGSAAELADLKTAFYGLGAISCLLVLFALRTIGQRRAPAAPTLGMEMVGERRSSIPQPEFDAPPAQTSSGQDGLPRNARMRARSTIEATEIDEVQPAARIPDMGGGAVRPDPVAAAATSATMADRPDDNTSGENSGHTDAMMGSAGSLPPAAPPPPRQTLQTHTDMQAAIQQVEALINREKAERGAQIARLEALIKEASAATGAAPGVAHAEGVLEEKLKKFLPIAAFNQAMNEKVLPRLDAAVDKKIEAALTPEKMREAAGIAAAQATSGEATEGEAPARAQDTGAFAELRGMVDKALAQIDSVQTGLKGEIDAVRSAADTAGKAAEDAVKASRDAVEGALTTVKETTDRAFGQIEEVRAGTKVELDAVREKAEHAAKAVEAAGTQGTAAAGNIIDQVKAATDRALSEIENLKSVVGQGPAADGGEGKDAQLSAHLQNAISAVEAKVEGRVGEALGAAEELRGGLRDVMAHVSSMGAKYSDLLARVERIGSELPQETKSPGGADQVSSEVEALRDALTTIIEQNREIRAQQDMLTARFDAPLRVEVEQPDKS
ncbi:MAG: hypothetical protein AAGF45_10405, partial [Pseudomonadota bacterium]